MFIPVSTARGTPFVGRPPERDLRQSSSLSWPSTTASRELVLRSNHCTFSRNDSLFSSHATLPSHLSRGGKGGGDLAWERESVGKRPWSNAFFSEGMYSLRVRAFLKFRSVDILDCESGNELTFENFV